jgi:hypothetical protein
MEEDGDLREALLLNEDWTSFSGRFFTGGYEQDRRGRDVDPQPRAPRKSSASKVERCARMRKANR